MALALTDLTPAFELLTTEPLSGRISADSLPLALVAAAVPQLVDGIGVANVQLQIDGTLDVPVLAGGAVVQGGAFTIEPLGVRYTDIGARLTMADERIRIDSLTARSGGTATVGGTVQFEPRAGPTVALAVDLDRFRVMNDPEVAAITSSGRLSLTGQFPRPSSPGASRWTRPRSASPSWISRRGSRSPMWTSGRSEATRSWWRGWARHS